MEKIDMHIHSMYSFDNEMEIDKIIEEALQKDITTIALTDHIERSTTIIEATNFFGGESIRTRQIKKLNKLKNILVLNGGEISSPHLEIKRSLFFKLMPVDVILGSIHDIDRNALTEEEIINAYFNYYKMNLETLKYGDFDVLAHLGYIDKYYNYEYKNDKLIDEILILLIKKGIALEINTSAERRVGKNTFPNYQTIKRYKELGGNIVTIGSDAHDYNEIGDNIDNGYEIAKELKIKEEYFQKRKFKRII